MAKSLDKEKEQEILRLAFSGMSVSEISSHTGVHRNTVRNKLAANKRHLDAAENERMRKLENLARKQAQADFSTEVSIKRISPKLFARIEALIPIENDLDKLGRIAKLFHDMEQSMQDGDFRKRSSELVERLRSYSGAVKN